MLPVLLSESVVHELDEAGIRKLGSFSIGNPVPVPLAGLCGRILPSSTPSALFTFVGVFAFKILISLSTQVFPPPRWPTRCCTLLLRALVCSYLEVIVLTEREPLCCVVFSLLRSMLYFLSPFHAS